MSQWENPVAIGSLLRSTATCAERMRASGDRVFTHRQISAKRAKHKFDLRGNGGWAVQWSLIHPEKHIFRQ